ncbi:GDCCVxC domain-containing (seleno)protein [Polynucleobacter sp. JS-Safj-400b-B2]|uniref:GDCCVxC domain-containing (seleno)protein n=1 Tax=Polynucleobacter sp. JS-Safj-400b-B2 TaxID=2576921 RepID=UPI00351D8D5D
MNKTIQYSQATVTCPYCQASEIINSEEGAQHFYRCRSCSAILKPKSGDCCILCSFGNRDCTSSEQNLAI